jgi:hypothetical protein
MKSKPKGFAQKACSKVKTWLERNSKRDKWSVMTSINGQPELPLFVYNDKKQAIKTAKIVEQKLSVVAPKEMKSIYCNQFVQYKVVTTYLRGIGDDSQDDGIAS